MTNYGKYNIVYRLQKWMDTAQGQTFLNYAYSWGASIVILGALFKLTYLPGADVALFLGMGTEVLVFFISAFDRPFDKTAEGREMPTRVTPEFLATGKVSYTNAESQKYQIITVELYDRINFTHKVYCNSILIKDILKSNSIIKLFVNP